VTRTGHGRPGPYGRVGHNPGGRHPVDVAVEQLAPVQGLNRRIREADSRLTAALGDQRLLWLHLEELLTNRSTLREQAHFDLGYEHGFAAGRVDALRSLAGAGAPAEGVPANEQKVATRAFSDRCRDLAIQTGLPGNLIVAAMLEVAWALAAGLPEEDESPNPHNRRNEE